MSRQSLGGSGKKAKAKGSVNSPAGKGLGQEGAAPSANNDGRLHTSVVFQSDRSSSDDCALGDILLTASQMQSLQLSPGAFVAVQLGQGRALCRAWVNRRLSVLPSTECAVLNRAWQACIQGDQKTILLDRAIVLASHMLPCSAIVLALSAERPEAISSLSFRAYLKDLLLGVPLQCGVEVSVALLGCKFSLRVTQLVGNKPTVDGQGDGNGDSRPVFWQTTSTTQFYFQSSADAVATPPFLLDKPKAAAPTVGRSMEEILTLVRRRFAGYDDALALAAKTLVEGLHSFPSSGATTAPLWKQPRGMVVCGPAGTGKTTLLLALVEALECSVVRLDAKILLLNQEGEAETELRRVFFSASQLAPCVILMDNMHLLCCSRSSSTISDAQKRLVSCWLTLVDGMNTASGIFILGGTARVGDLDPAVRRPGRMDVEVELSVPSPADRLRILTFLVAHSQLEVSDDVLQEVAQLAHGMVGSDLVLVMKEAAFRAAQRGYLAPTGEMDGLIEQMRTQLAVSSPIPPAPRSPLPASLASERPASTPAGPSSPLLPWSPRQTGPPLSPAVVAISGPAHAPLSTSWADWQGALQRVPPSSLREVQVEVPAVHWEDIGGMEEVKRALRQVIDWPLQHARQAAGLGLGALKGVLLYGPPGCSKTLLAKAIATETSMNFLAVRGPELLSKWVGESEKAIQTLFRRARAASPAIVFFDEIDALSGTRGESSAGVSDRVLSQLLTELDGVQTLHHVVVLAATNRPDMLDPALVRPGRIDRKIYVPPPDGPSRRRILQLELQRLPLDGEIDLDVLEASTAGFSGAEVVSICNEAALRALEVGRETVDHTLVLEAAQRVQPQITADMLRFYEDYRSRHRTF